MNHQTDMHHPSTSVVGGPSVQSVPPHQVVQSPAVTVQDVVIHSQPQHIQGGQRMLVDDMMHNIMVDHQRQEQPKVVLVTMPDGIGGSGEGDVEIIVTTHLSPDEDDSMYVLQNNDGHYQQLQNASVGNMDLPQSVSDYNSSVLNPHQGRVHIENAGGLHMDTSTETSYQQPGLHSHLQTFPAVNTSANAIYSSALSSGIIPSTQTNAPDVVYSSTITPVIESSAFQTTATALPGQEMISLTRFPASVDQTSNIGSNGTVPIQISSMSASATQVPSQHTSVLSSNVIQGPDVNTMTPEEREQYEKQETMKSLELVDAQWKISRAELSPKSPECVLFPVDVGDDEGGVNGDKAVFAYEVVDINAESEQQEDSQQNNTSTKMGTDDKSVVINMIKQEDGPVTTRGSIHPVLKEEKNENGSDLEENRSDNKALNLPDDVLCTICQKTFSEIEALQSHVLSHIESQTFHCDKCEMSFTDDYTLRCHKACHADSLTCDTCSKTFSTAGYLKSHMRTHTEEKIHVCGVCNETCTSSHMLRRHKIKCHKDVIEACEICSKEFDNSEMLQQHMQEHHGESQVTTRRSGRKRKTSRGRKNTAKKAKKTPKTTTAQMKVKMPLAGSRPQTRGLKKKQAAEKAGKASKGKQDSAKQHMFTCILCREKFQDKIQLKKHARKHLGQRILRCDKCGKVFQDSIKLKMHKLSHSGESFSCDFCGKTFTYANTLAMHKKTHLKEKGFKCKTCGKRFSTVELMKTHKATHPATKPFVCDVCEKAFTSQYYLKAHKRLHTGEKHYGCLQCGESFMFSTGLRRHVIKDHEGPSARRRTSSGAQRESTQSLSGECEGEGEDGAEINDYEMCTYEPLSIDEQEEPYPMDMKMKVEKHALIKVSKDEDGMLECQCCGKKFQSTPALNTHMKEHVEFPHTCDICKKTFSRKLYLQKHLQRHNDERPYSCNTCGKSFRSAAYLQQHEQIHTGEKSYQCQLCGQEFIFANSLRRHLKSHDDLGPNIQGMVRKKKRSKNYRPVSEFSPEKVSKPTCVLCGYSFQTVTQLDEHVKSHSGENPVYECSVCKKEFNSHRALWRHKQSHVDDQPIVCSVCNKTFRSSYYLKSHMNLHNGKKPYKCKHCDMTFVYASTRRRHMRMHIPEESMNYMCSICGKKFLEQGEFDRHIIGHTGEKPFMCDVCGKTFATKALLRSHMNRHNGERQFKCQFCNKLFLYRYRLERHIKTHNGEKSFLCNICGKGFLTQAYLSTHLRYHTGEKPYKCEVCGEEFSFSNTFRRHKRIHTGQTLNCGVCGKMCLELFDLKRHMQSHSDQKTVMCDICGKTFSHQGSCKRHMRRIHPEAVMPFQVPENINVQDPNIVNNGQVLDGINVEIHVS